MLFVCFIKMKRKFSLSTDCGMHFPRNIKYVSFLFCQQQEPENRLKGILQRFTCFSMCHQRYNNIAVMTYSSSHTKRKQRKQIGNKDFIRGTTSKSIWHAKIRRKLFFVNWNCSNIYTSGEARGKKHLATSRQRRWDEETKNNFPTLERYCSF